MINGTLQGFVLAFASDSKNLDTFHGATQLSHGKTLEKGGFCEKAGIGTCLIASYGTQTVFYTHHGPIPSRFSTFHMQISSSRFQWKKKNNHK